MALSLADLNAWAERNKVPPTALLCFAPLDRDGQATTDSLPVAIESIQGQVEPLAHYQSPLGRPQMGSMIILSAKEPLLSLEDIPEEEGQEGDLLDIHPVILGETVYYHPKSDPKAQLNDARILPATVVRIWTRLGKRPLLNLKVHTDGAVDVHRTSIPHKNAALDGQSYYTFDAPEEQIIGASQQVPGPVAVPEEK